MTPDASLVADLHAYDPKLRIRWAKHTERWFIERKLDKRNPSLVIEQPLPESRQGLQRDLWESWQEGYVHVLSVDRELCHWSFIAPELARMDSWRQGGMQAINRALDDEAEAWDKAGDKKIDNYVEAASDDAYERLAWLTGRRVAVSTPEPAYIDTGLGFKMRDRRIG